MAAPTITQTVQISGTANTTNGFTYTFTGVVAGATLIIRVSNGASAARTITVSDDRSNSWSHIQNAISGRQNCLAYAANVAAGNTVVQISVDVNTLFLEGWATELSDCDFDVSGTYVSLAAISTHYAAESGNIDTAADVMMLVAGRYNSNVGANVVGTGFTSESINAFSMFQYKASTSPETDQRGSWTNTGTNRTEAGIIASFKSPAGVAGLFLPIHRRKSNTSIGR